MKSGDKVIYKKEVVERLNRFGKNPQVNVKMEVLEIRKGTVLVDSGGSRISVNPEAIELAPT